MNFMVTFWSSTFKDGGDLWLYVCFGGWVPAEGGRGWITMPDSLYFNRADESIKSEDGLILCCILCLI